MIMLHRGDIERFKIKGRVSLNKKFERVLLSGRLIFLMRWRLRFDRIAFIPFRFLLAFIGIIFILYFLLFLFLKSPQGVEFVSKRIVKIIRENTGLNINLDSIRLDIFTADLRLSDLNLKNDKGKSIIKIKGASASLSLPHLLFGKLVISDISINGLKAKVEIRDKKIIGLEGLFEREKKESKKEERTRPFDITIEKFVCSSFDIEFLYEDLLSSRVEIKRLSGSYIARALDLTLSNMKAKVRVEEDQYEIDVDATVSLFENTLSIKGLTLLLDGKRALNLSGEIKDINKPQFRLRTDINMPLNYLVNYPVRMKRAEGELRIGCNLKGSIDLPVAECVIEGTGVNIENYRIGNFKGEAVYDSGDIQIRNFRLDNYGNKVVVNASGDIKKDLKFVGNLNIERIELAELLRNLGVNSIVMLEIKGPVDFAFEITPEKGFVIDARPALSVKGPRIFSDYYFLPRRGSPVFALKGANLVGDVTITEKGVMMKSVDIQTERSSVKVKNSFIGFSKGGYIDLSAESDSLDLSDISPLAGLEMKGVAGLRAEVKGPFSSIRISGDLNAMGFVFENFYGGALKTSVEFFNNKLAFKNIIGRINEMLYKADVTLDMNGAPDIDVKAEIEQAGIKTIMSVLPAQFRGIDIKRGVAGIKADLSGPLDRLSGKVEGSIRDLVIADEEIKDVKVDLLLDQGDLVVDKLLARLYGGEVEAEGKIKKDQQLNFDVRIKDIRIQDINLIKTLPVKPFGLFSGRLKGAGSFSEPVIDFSGGIEDLRILSTGLGRLNIDADLKGRQYDVSASLSDKRLTFSLRSDKDIPERYLIRASVRDLDILRLFVELGDISTSEDVDIELVGDIKSGEISGSILLNRMVANIFDINLQLKRPVSLNLSRSRIDFSEILAGGENISIKVNPSQFDPEALNISGSATIPLALVKGLTKNSLSASGSLLLDFYIQGSLDKPDLNITGQIDGSLIKLSFFPHPFENTSLRFYVQKNMLVISELKGDLAGGYFKGGGEIRLDSFVPRSFDVRVDIFRAFLSFPKELPSVVSGYITIQGEPKRLFIGGDIDIEKATYSKNIDFNTLLVELTRKRPRFTSYSKEDEFVYFDIGLKAPSGIVVKNNLITDSEFRADLRLVGSNERIGLIGMVNAIRAKMVLSGNEYTLKRGILQFTERYRIAYNLDFVLSTVCHDTNTGLDHNIEMYISGTDEDIRIHYKDNSNPPFSETEIVTCLALGSTPQKAGGQERTQDESLGILTTVTGVDQKLKDIIPIPIDTFKISTKYSEALRLNVPQVQVSLRLMQNLRLNYSSSLMYSQDQKVELDYRLNRNTSLRTQWNSQAQVPVGNLGVDIKWTWEF